MAFRKKAAPPPPPPPRTLFEKIWDAHVVHRQDDGTCVIYIDRHLVHEVTSPQAFEGLRLAGRKVRAPEKTLAVVDHNIQTTDRAGGILDPESRLQVEQLAIDVGERDLEVVGALAVRERVVQLAGLGVDQVRRERAGAAAEQHVRQ